MENEEAKLDTPPVEDLGCQMLKFCLLLILFKRLDDRRLAANIRASISYLVKLGKVVRVGRGLYQLAPPKE